MHLCIACDTIAVGDDGFMKTPITPQLIKEDLREKRRYLYKQLVGYLLGFAMMCGAFLWGINQHKEGDLPFKIILGVLSAVVLALLIWKVTEIRRHRFPADVRAVLVKDYVVGTERRDHLRLRMRASRLRFYVVETLHILFAQYGEIQASEGEYNYARCDDEYYLLLSKPHVGKIVLAYHADSYAWPKDEKCVEH